VEEVRSGVIAKKSKISLQDVESMALTLSQCSKTVTQLRQAYPALEANLRLSGENTLMGDFLKTSSERLEGAWKRCKKLTGKIIVA